VFIFVSSVAAAGPAPKDRLRAESDSPAPVSNYGRSKRAGEIAVEELARQLPATVVRPGIVFGQRNSETFPIFATIRRFRCHPIAGCRSPRLSLIHVEDLVEILLRSADRGARIDPSEIESGRLGRGYYFACAPEFPTYAELGRMIAKPLGRPWMLPIPAPYPLPWLIAGGNQLMSQLRRRPDSFNLDKIREARVASWACSPEAARRDLGFAPPRSLAERLSETVQWYFEHGWL
jgi:nucleoside-diphosphate-sugar epimerase